MKPIVLMILAALAFLLRPKMGSSLDLPLLAGILGLGALTVTIHLVTVKDKNWVRVDTLFLLGYCIVNLQWPLMILIGGKYPDYWRFDHLVDSHLMFSTWFSTVLLLVWAAGYRVKLAAKKKPNPERFQFRWGLPVATASVFLAFVLLAGPSYILGDIYKEQVEGVGLTGSITGVAAYVYSVYQTLILVLVAYAFYAARHLRAGDGSIFSLFFRSRRLLVCTAIVLVGCLYFTIAGERGQVIQVLCAAALAWSTTVGRLRLRTFLGAVAFGAFAASYIRFWRAESAESFAESISVLGYWGYTENLANSLYSTLLAYEVVEWNGGWFYGSLLLSNVLGIVPFAQKAFLELTGLSVAQISGPAAITTFALGDNPHTGLGTTLVGDLYMNWGVYVSLAVMFAYGLLCRFFQENLNGPHGFSRFAAAICFGSLAIYMGRAPLLAQLQPVVFGLIVSTIMMRVIAKHE